ncbi:hypothetical protein [Streptomyces sp. NPDC060035]|uniref:hypothetical protein n=1 Tax=Streptomyces sp. NPDC060035 TaxID=3347044 RepID=UPI003674F337
MDDWVDLINAGGSDFRRSWGGQISPNARPFVLVHAYLLGEFTVFDRLGRFMRPPLARRVFGDDLIDDAVRRICKVLADWGYRRDADKLTAVICQMLLLNRSPLLEDLSMPSPTAPKPGSTSR